MKAQNFGARLRQLRIQAGLTQRELAERINVDFSYLSKIEGGAVPPPSEKVISQLAEILNADKDELTILAGRVPPDIAQILQNRETLQRLRTAQTRQMAQASKKRGETIATMKSLSKIAIPIILVIAVAASLWFAVPMPDAAVAANNEGLIYNNNGEYHKAIVAFNKAIELDPNFAPAYNNRGWAYIELEQYEQGIADCTKAIELDPGLALAYRNRGWAYIELEQYEQAIADYDKAIELDPNLLEE